MAYRKRRVKYPGEIRYDDDGWVVTKTGDGPADDIAFVQTETLADVLIAGLGARDGPVPAQDPGLPEAKTAKGKSRLACPHCGARGLDNFRWLEDITSFRELISLKDGVLRMHSHYDVYDENGTMPRLLCKKCDHECLVPGGIELDWE
jgi:hypothetical protein